MNQPGNSSTVASVARIDIYIYMYIWTSMLVGGVQGLGFRVLGPVAPSRSFMWIYAGIYGLCMPKDIPYRGRRWGLHRLRDWASGARFGGLTLLSC